MNKLKEVINNDLKNAMRAKEENKLMVLRMINSAIKNKEIALTQGEKVELDDEQIIELLNSEVKKRKDSITAYNDGKREDLAKKEELEIEIIKAYLPEQMSDEDVLVVVKEVINGFESPTMKDFGQIIGQVITRTKGRADGGKVSQFVKEVLK